MVFERHPGKSSCPSLAASWSLPNRPACHVCLSQQGWCPWRLPLSPPSLSPLGSGFWGFLLSVAGLVEGETDLLAWDHPMKIRMGRMPGDAPASLSYASGNRSHVPCVGGRVKLTPFTRCSRVLQALQDLLLSNTYLKKNQSLPALSGKFCFGVFFFFF